MLSISKKIFYAVEAVLYVAYNAKTAPIGGTALAAAQNLPTRYLEPIMQKLVRAGILRGVRGPAGGYALGRERRRITLADICTSVGGEADFPVGSSTVGKIILHPAMSELLQSWQRQLDTVTIANLCERATDAGIESAVEIPTDFTI